MTVKKVWAVYFSGTGTTKKTVDRIARRLAEALGTDCEVYDYTLPAARRQELTIPSGDVAVVGCPTYAGRVPNLLMPYLRDMVHGKGALAVPVVLFGNRNYDDALMELSRLLTADGFSCVAGGAFVGEHSFSRTLGAGSARWGGCGGDGCLCRACGRQAGSGRYCACHCGRLRSHTALLHPP